MLLLAGCAGLGGDDTASSFAAGNMPVQPYPANYRADVLAFMRTYLNDPKGVRNAAISEPVQRTLGGRQRYLACLRYTATHPGDRYDPAEDRALLFLDGRLDRILTRANEQCAGVTYAPFPDLEKLTR
jgi:hypothetical protein